MPSRCCPIEAAVAHVLDLGYFDCAWRVDLDAKGCRIVTRFKKNTPFRVVEEHAVAEASDRAIGWRSTGAIRFLLRRRTCRPFNSDLTDLYCHVDRLRSASRRARRSENPCANTMCETTFRFPAGLTTFTHLDAALRYADGSKGGRPPYDVVSMFKVLILAAQHHLSDERTAFFIRDRLSWLRFLGFELGRPTPDENTIRLFREKLTASGAIARSVAGGPVSGIVRPLPTGRAGPQRRRHRRRGQQRSDIGVRVVPVGVRWSRWRGTLADWIGVVFSWRDRDCHRLPCH